MKGREAALNLVMFLVTLGIARHQQWQAGDVIWGLWISSLTIGYSFLVLAIAGQLARGETFRRGRTGQRPAGQTGSDILLPKETPRTFSPAILLLSLPIAAFMFAFFTVHFGMFHFVHGLFLNGFFPIVTGSPFGTTPDGTLAFVAGIADSALRSYWPFVLTSAATRLPDYREALTGGRGDLMLMPYLNVIRMHLMIFLLAGLSVAGLRSQALLVVLALYFFPFGSLFRAAVGAFKRRSGRGGLPGGDR